MNIVLIWFSFNNFSSIELFLTIFQGLERLIKTKYITAEVLQNVITAVAQQMDELCNFSYILICGAT